MPIEKGLENLIGEQKKKQKNTEMRNLQELNVKKRVGKSGGPL